MRPFAPPARPLAAPWLVAGGLAVLAAGAGCAGRPRPPAAGSGAEPVEPAPRVAAEAAPDATGTRPLPAPTAARPAPASTELLPAEISTVGWDSLTDSPVVLLRELGSGKVVPIWVGVAEARAIALALHGVEPPRPMTHDLMKNLIADLGARLLEVHVHELRGDTYYGLLQLEVRGAAAPLLVDARPSDALALALRTGAAIRVGRQIVEQAPALDFLPPEAGDQVVRAVGLTVVAVGAELRAQRRLPDRPGLLVTAANGEAAARGLRAGDLIVALNGEPASAPIALLDAVRATPPGVPLQVTFWRDGEERTVELAVAAAQPEVGIHV